MPEQCCCATRGGLGFERLSVPHVPQREAGQRGQRSQGTSEPQGPGYDRKQRRQASPRDVRQREIASCFSYMRVIVAKQSRPGSEQDFAARGNRVRVAHFVEQCGPTLRDARQRGATHPARQQFIRACSKPWLRRRRAGVEPLQRVAPPRQPDRAQCRLRRACDHLPQRVVNCEQGIEGGPNLDRPIKPDEVAVARLSDKGRLSRP